MAVDMFLKLGDVKGESVDGSHKDEIDVLAWSWGMSQSGTTHMGGGGGSGGRARELGGRGDLAIAAEEAVHRLHGAQELGVEGEEGVAFEIHEPGIGEVGGEAGGAAGGDEGVIAHVHDEDGHAHA